MPRIWIWLPSHWLPSVPSLVFPAADPLRASLPPSSFILRTLTRCANCMYIEDWNGSLYRHRIGVLYSKRRVFMVKLIRELCAYCISATPKYEPESYPSVQFPLQQTIDLLIRHAVDINWSFQWPSFLPPSRFSRFRGVVSDRSRSRKSLSLVAHVRGFQSNKHSETFKI